MDLKKLLREKRPNVSDATIRTYASLLKNMFYKAHAKETEFDPAWFKHSEQVLDTLKDKTPQTRKTNLASIVVLLDGKDCEDYVTIMNKDADTTKEQYMKQEKTEKQKVNWLDYPQVVELWTARFEKMKPILNSKTALDAHQSKQIVQFMILTLTSGIYFPPRRSEWISMKVRNFDKDKDNYIDLKKSQFVFNQYKTAKTMKQEVVAYPKDFKLILNKYLKHINNDYLIFNTQGNQLTNVQLTQQLNTIFGKNISTSMLRHIYLSHKFESMPSLKELTDTANSLGHSVETMMEYIKKD